MTAALDDGCFAALSDEVWETHRDLGSVAGRFLEHVTSDPEYGRWRDHRAADLPEWVLSYPYTLQPWPTFVGPRKLAELEKATLGLVELVRLVPERVFDFDVQRIDRFYQVGNPMLTNLSLEEPNGIDQGAARCDVVDDGERLLGLEVNMGAYLGGWQDRFWLPWWLQHPGVASFLDEEGHPRLHHSDIVFHKFRHAAERALAGPGADDGTLNVMLALDAAERRIGEGSFETIAEIYRRALADLDEGLEGELVLGYYPHGVRRQGRRLWCGDVPVRAVIEYTHLPSPLDVFRAFKSGEISLLNPPIYRWLGDKRNLALLSQHADSDRFDRRERSLIRDHVPWSRLLEPGTTTYRGDQVRLPEFLIQERERFVIKPGRGMRGDDVTVGRYTPQKAWVEAVAKGIGCGAWMVQEFSGSRPYLYQSGDVGWTIHDLIWGLFCFGDTFGGIFLRMQPKESTGKDGVINAARGARECIVLEVADGPAG